jgi:hypothetical protein
MRRVWILVGLIGLAALQVLAAPDPKLLSLVGPDIKVLGGIQVEKGLATPFGQFLLAQIPQNPAIRQFAAASGFDFTKDLKEVLFAAQAPTAGQGPTDRNLIVLSGTFDINKVVALANLTGGASNIKSGIQWITPAQSPSGTSLAFLNSSLVLAGPPDMIEAAIALGNSAQPSPATPSALAQRAIAAGTVNDIWFVSATPVSEMLQNTPTPFPVAVFDSILGYSAGLHLEEMGGTFSAEVLTRTDQDALTLATVLKLAAGMADNPQALWLKQIQVETAGSALRLTLNLTESQMEDLVKPSERTQRVVAR